MAAESPGKTETPEEEDDIDGIEHVEMEQPKLSLSVVAEDTLEVQLRSNKLSWVMGKEMFICSKVALLASFSIFSARNEPSWTDPSFIMSS